MSPTQEAPTTGGTIRTVSALFTSPPSPASTSIHSLWPFNAAANIGVVPSCTTFRVEIQSCTTNRLEPLDHSTNKPRRGGEHTMHHHVPTHAALTMPASFTSAPAATKTFTHSTWPCFVATSDPRMNQISIDTSASSAQHVATQLRGWRDI